MSKTVSSVRSFYPQLIHELILNLFADFDDPSASEFRKVHICNLCFNISHTIINQFLKVSLPSNIFFSLLSPQMLTLELTEGSMCGLLIINFLLLP